QSANVELSGGVRDPAGLTIEGADVKLVNANSQAERAYVSGADGEYHFFALQPGTYSVTVTKNGFTTLRRDGVVLRVGDQVSLDLPLQIGGVTETGNITRAAPLLQSTRRNAGFVSD